MEKQWRVSFPVMKIFSIRMKYVNILLLCSFSLIAVSGNESEPSIDFVTADEIEERGTLNETFHHVCQMPEEDRVKFCKETLKQEFAVKNGIKYVEGGPLGKEKRYEFRLNDGLGITLVKQSVVMIACTCPTTPPIYLRNDFGSSKAVLVYVKLPYSAHVTTEKTY